MKNWKSMGAIALVGLMLPVAARADDSMAAADPLVEDVVANLEDVRVKLMALAEATPDSWFAWQPSADVRTVSEVYMHTASVNLLLPAALGAAPPEGVRLEGVNPFALMAEWEATVTSKADVMAKVAESFDYVGGALRSLEGLDDQVELFGPPRSKRAFVLIILGHAHEHLGQSIAYARSMGIAPPWSQGDGDADSAE